MNQHLRLLTYAVLIAAVCLRLFAIDSQSLWLDELWTLEIACGHDADHQLLSVDQILDHAPDLTRLQSAIPVWRIWTNMDRVTGPPGYYILLRIWMMAFGQSETALRSLSALLSILALIIFGWAIKLSLGNEAAIWATAIAALAGPHIHYAQDTRPYALLMFEAGAAIVAVVKITSHGVSVCRSIALTIASLCLLLTHYFAIAVLFALIGYGVLCTTGRSRKNILLCVSIAVLVFTVIWGPFACRQIPMFSTHDRAAAFLHESGSGHMRQIVWRVLAMPMSLLCDARPIPRWYVVGILFYPLAIYALIRHRVKWLWLILFITVVGLLAVLDFVHSTAHLAYIRYALMAGPSVCAIISGSILIHPALGRLLSGATILFCLFSLPAAYAQSNTDFRSLGQAINASTQKGDLIVFAGPAETYAPQILYLSATHYAWPLPGPVLLIQSPAKPELMAQLKSHRRLWLVADPAVLTARVWLPGYHLVAGKSWAEVGSLIEMQIDSTAE